MILLVIGLAAVVVVILIAAFLSVRLGRAEDHEEPMTESGARQRGRRDAVGQRWRDDSGAREAPRSSADSRRGRAAGRQPHGGPGRGERDPDGSRRERERGRDLERGRDRERRSVPDDVSSSRQRARGYEDEPPTGDYPSQRRVPAAQGAARPAPGRADRRPGSGDRAGRDRTRSYDSGAVPRVRAGERPSAGFPSGPYPLPADFPSADFPSADVPPARTRANPEAAQAGATGRDRAESRHRGDKQAQPPKGRGRQHRGKRDDDDDWPSTEWDKLSDEQYWAELSADKPLSTTARSAQPADASSAAAPAETTAVSPPPRARSRAGSRSEQGRVPPAIPSASAPAEQDTDTGLRGPRRGRGAGREATTQRLPVRGRAQADGPAPGTVGSSGGARRADASAARPPAASAPLPGGPASRPAEEPNLAMLASLGDSAPGTPRPPDDDDPLTSPSFSQRTRTTDSRSYSAARKEAPAASRGSHRREGNGSRASNGYGSSGNGSSGNGAAYPSNSGVSPDYGHASASPAPTWYGTANGHTPAYGNPPADYRDRNGTGYEPSSPPGYTAAGSADYAGYPSPPSAGYAPPAFPGEPAAGPPAPSYDGQAAMPSYPSIPPGSLPGQALSSPEQYAYPYGYPEQNGYAAEQGTGQYPDSSGNAPYRPDYSDGYQASQYPPPGYEEYGYPPQG